MLAGWVPTEEDGGKGGEGRERAQVPTETFFF